MDTVSRPYSFIEFGMYDTIFQQIEDVEKMLLEPLSYAKLIHLNFHPLEVLSGYRDPQLQVAENYSYLFNLSRNICKSRCLDTHFIHNNSDLFI